MVSFGILGPLEVFDRDERVAIGGPGQAALLSFLLIHANRALSGELVEALWRESNRAGATKRLQVAVARLRKTLPVGRVVDEPRLR